MDAPYNGSKPSHAIEEEITQTRRRLSVAVEALDRELVPGRMIERGAQALQRALEPPGGDQGRAYAIPLALIAVGLGWLFMLRRRHWRAELSASSRETPADRLPTQARPESCDGTLDPRRDSASRDTAARAVGPAGFEPATTPL